MPLKKIAQLYSAFNNVHMNTLPVLKKPTDPLVAPWKTGERLLVVIRPDDFACAEFTERGRYLSTAHGLRGRPLRSTPYHLSIAGSKEYRRVPEKLIALFCVACSNAAEKTPPFEVVLNEAMSFSGNEEQHPLVMCSDRKIPALRQLFDDFHAELGGETEALPFVPHVTLMYEKRLVFNRPIEPISWMAGRVDVVIRHSGADKYEEIGSYYFRG